MQSDAAVLAYWQRDRYGPKIAPVVSGGGGQLLVTCFMKRFSF